MARRESQGGFLSQCSLLLVPGGAGRQRAVFQTLHSTVKSHGGTPLTVEEATRALKRREQLRVTHVVSGAEASQTLDVVKKLGVTRLLQQAGAVYVRHSWLQACLAARQLVPVDDTHRLEATQSVTRPQPVAQPRATPRKSPARRPQANGV